VNAMTEVVSPDDSAPTLKAAQLSLRDLEPSVARRIRALHERRSRWNIVCVLFPIGWIGTAWLMAHLPERPILLPMRLLGVLVIGICIQAMAILMHEALHGNLFRRALLDRVAIIVFGVPAFFSGMAYKVAHLNHHRKTRTEHDQDEISNLCKTPGQYRLLFYVWFFAGTLLYFFIVPWKALSIGRPAERRQIFAEYVAIFAIYSGLVAWAIVAGHVQWLFWYWLLPAQVAMFLSNIRGLAEHLCTSDSELMTKTRTTRSNAVVSFLMLNLNYHLEHHLFPGIPWYNLRKAHLELRSLYAPHAVFIERCYSRYAVKAFFQGPSHEIRDPGGMIF
jgi:fatty acid desaturase